MAQAPSVPRRVLTPPPAPVDPPVSPPTATEKYWYMGRQHRWLLAAQGIAYTLVACSIARFAVADARLLLFLVPMSLFSITAVISLLSGLRG